MTNTLKGKKKDKAPCTASFRASDAPTAKRIMEYAKSRAWSFSQAVVHLAGIGLDIETAKVSENAA